MAVAFLVGAEPFLGVASQVEGPFLAVAFLAVAYLDGEALAFPFQVAAAFPCLVAVAYPYQAGVHVEASHVACPCLAVAFLVAFLVVAFPVAFPEVDEHIAVRPLLLLRPPAAASSTQLGLLHPEQGLPGPLARPFLVLRAFLGQPAFPHLVRQARASHPLPAAVGPQLSWRQHFLPAVAQDQACVSLRAAPKFLFLFCF